MRYEALPPSAGAKLAGVDWAVTTADVDGDGRSEVALYSSGLPSLAVVSYLDYGDLEPAWTGAQPCQLIGASIAVNAVPGGWPLAASDSYLAADVDGDGSAEVLVYQPSTGTVGVLKWQGSGLVLLWEGPVVAQLGLVPSGCHLLAVDVDGDGSDELFVYDSQSRSVAVLRWRAGALTAMWQVQGTIPGGLVIQTWDQFFCVDLDAASGGRSRSVVAYSADDGYLVALGWDPGSQQMQIVGEATHTTIAAGVSSSWTLAPDDVFLAGNVVAGRNDELVVVNFGAGAAGLITWTGSQFQVRSVVELGGAQDVTYTEALLADLDGEGANLVLYSPGPVEPTFGRVAWTDSGSEVGAGFVCGVSWPSALAAPTTTPILVAADVDGDGADELVLVSGAGPSLGMLRWRTSDGLVVGSVAVGRVGGFNPSLVAAGPTTAFAPFAGVQADIYAQVGPSLTPSPDLDVRSSYTNSDDKLNFEGWATQLLSASATSAGWAWLGDYAAADVAAVLPVLAAECGSVSTLYGHYDNMHTSLVDVNVQQDGDLQHCMDLIQQTVTPSGPSATVSYWLEGIFDAFVWGGAAVPGADVLAVPFAMFASILGTLFGASDKPPPPPATVDYAAFKEKLDDDYVSAASTLTTELNTMVADPYKLAFLGARLQKAWQLDLSQASTFVKNGSAANQVSFYQSLLPEMFTIRYYRTAELPVPTYISRIDFSVILPLKCPSYTFISQELGPQPDHVARFDVWLWAGPATDYNYSYPAQSLVDDLFSTLGVAQSDFFTSVNGWTLPQYDGSVVVFWPQ